MERNEYDILLVVNGRRFTRLIIDSHYKKKHHTIDDVVIVQLTMSLYGQNFKAEKIGPDGFKYFTRDKILLGPKLYKLVWTWRDDDNFIGIVNCYRRD